MGLIKALAIKVLKAKWGSLLPAVFKAAAEGELGEPMKKVYWFGAGHRTFTGAVLLAAGAGLETICAGYPDVGWSCSAARYVYYAGAFLTTVGLVDGGTRAPWPKGTQIPAEDKR